MKAGAGFMYVRKIAMPLYNGLRELSFQLLQQFDDGFFLWRCAVVYGFALGIYATDVADMYAA